MLRKKSITLSGHETSVALEAEFWDVLGQVAAARGVSLSQLVRDVDEGRGRHPLASACRLTALAWAFEGQADPGRPRSPN